MEELKAQAEAMSKMVSTHAPHKVFHIEARCAMYSQINREQLLLILRSLSLLVAQKEIYLEAAMSDLAIYGPPLGSGKLGKIMAAHVPPKNG